MSGTLAELSAAMVRSFAQMRVALADALGQVHIGLAAAGAGQTETFSLVVSLDDVRWGRAASPVSTMCGHIEVLGPRDADYLDEVLSAAAAFLPGLRSVFLNAGDLVSDLMVADLAATWPGLVRVNLNGCGSVTDASVACLARDCPGLRFLALDGTGVTGLSIEALAAGCPWLRSVACRDTRAGPLPAGEFSPRPWPRPLSDGWWHEDAVGGTCRPPMD